MMRITQYIYKERRDIASGSDSQTDWRLEEIVLQAEGFLAQQVHRYRRGLNPYWYIFLAHLLRPEYGFQHFRILRKMRRND